MIEKECKPFTIKGTLYDIDEVYFEHLMVQSGEYLCKRYHEVDLVSPLELLTQIAYTHDLYLQQQLYIAYWLGLHSKDMEYERLILQCLDKIPD